MYILVIYISQKYKLVASFPMKSDVLIDSCNETSTFGSTEGILKYDLKPFDFQSSFSGKINQSFKQTVRS